VRDSLADRTPRTAAVYVLAVALVLLRSAVWVLFEQAHFDSDQAIIGLMAKHLAEGRAFPLFFYGQHYMLAVEPWLVAPFFKAAAPTVTVLKLPLVGINAAIAVLLLWILINRLRLAPWQAFATSIFFILPPPLASARLVEAQGSNIEPLLYVLVLWLLRTRPIAFGLFAGFAFLHREFTIYAVAAVMFLDAITGRLFARERLREYAVAWGMAALVLLTAALLKPKADILGPGTAGMVGGGSLDAQVSAWGGLICWPPTQLRENLRWLATENLGTIFNWKPDLLGPEGWTAVPVGHWWLAYVLGALVVVSSVQIARGYLRPKKVPESFSGKMSTAPFSASDGRWEFGVYLIAIAIQSAFAYAVLSCHVRDSSLLRYTLLTLYFPVGLLALFFIARPGLRLRASALALVMILVAGSLLDNVRYLTAYVHKPAPAPYRELANFLESQGVRYGRALYWTAYQLDFLTQERLIINPMDKVRIDEYRRIVDQHDKQLVRILPERDGCQSGVPFRLWCLENLDQARGAAPKP
jgi:hypothetical protein